METYKPYHVFMVLTLDGVECEKFISASSFEGLRHKVDNYLMERKNGKTP